MRVIILVLLTCAAAARIFFSLDSHLEGKKVRLTGTLYSEPREYGSSLLLRLHTFTFFVPRETRLEYGSHIIVEGTIKGQELQNVHVVTSRPPTSFLPYARARILSTIKRTLPEPESSLIAGVSIGAPNIPPSFNDLLRQTGTSHIVVASGGNLAILAGFLERTLSRVMRRRIFLPLIAFILLIYSVITGLGAPIVRALVMWFAIMLAQMTGRLVSPRYVLLITVLIMIIISPAWIRDVSFGLSVGATAGVMLLSTPLQRSLKKIPLISDALATSIAAQVGTLPISVLVFHDVKLLSPIWNVLVLWTVPYLTILGLVGSIVSLVFVPASTLLFWAAYPFAWYFVRLISLAG